VPDYLSKVQKITSHNLTPCPLSEGEGETPLPVGEGQGVGLW